MIHTTLRKKLYYWAGAYLALFTLIGFSSGLPAPRAAITMLIAHFASWVLIVAPFFAGGIVSLAHRAVRRFTFGKKTLFVLGATTLALVEEALALFWNNSIASSFGVIAPDNNILTASTNFLTLVTKHSVIVFIPMFIVWAYLLTKKEYSAEEAFVYFGITGILAEFWFAPSILPFLAGGFWVLVYGAMVYIPAQMLVGKKEGFTFSYSRASFAVVLSFLAALPVAFFVAILTK